MQLKRAYQATPAGSAARRIARIERRRFMPRIYDLTTDPSRFRRNPTAGHFLRRCAAVTSSEVWRYAVE